MMMSCVGHRVMAVRSLVGKASPFRQSIQYAAGRSLSTASDGSTEDDNVQASRDYCVDLVQRNDYNSYVAGFLFPAKHRNAYFAVKAFNVEIATIRDQIPKTALQSARLRFNFWRDLLKQMGENKRLPNHVNQPVALELCDHVQRYNLDVRLLERCLESRYSDIVQNGVFDSMDDLENYAEYSHSSINYLLLQILGIDNEELQFAASHLGVSSGIVALLKGYTFHAQNGICYLPRAVRSKHKLADNVAISGPKTEVDKVALQDATHDVASQAHAQLEAARKIFNNHPLRRQAYWAMMSSIPTDLYLKQLLSLHSDPFLACAAVAQQSPLPLLGSLLKGSISKKI